MRFYLLLSIFFFSALSFAQEENKKPYMFDENGIAIGENEFFSKLNSGIYYKKAVVSDTAVVAKLYVRILEGEMDSLSYNKFISYFEKTVQTKIDTKKPLVIYFFYESDKQLARHYANSKNLKDLNNNERVETFYVTQKGFQFKNSRHVFYEDTLDLVKETFFIPNVCCGSAVVIKPNGKYYKELGEFSTTNISEKALTDW